MVVSIGNYRDCITKRGRSNLFNEGGDRRSLPKAY